MRWCLVVPIVMENKVTINLNLSDVLMGDLIFYNIDLSFVVIVKRGWMNNEDTEVTEQATKPNYFSSSVSHNTMLCFYGRPRNCCVFLDFQAIRESPRRCNNQCWSNDQLTPPA